MSATWPQSLDHLASSSSGLTFLESLEQRIADARSRWRLVLGDPFPGCHASWAAPATMDGGHEVVVKVQFVHRESRHEADALLQWNGVGAIRLLDHDPDSGDMLLERAQPGGYLSDLSPERSTDVMVELLSRLLIPAGPHAPYDLVADEALRWADHLRERWEAGGRPYPEHIVDAAIECLESQASASRRSLPMLVHQDLHGHNVVASERGWLAIDPKPLQGPAAFAVAPVVRSNELGHSPAAVRHRFDRLVEGLSLDRDEALAWTIGQTVAWATSPRGHVARHIETVEWLLDGR